ncbi:class I SAM-dependent methyltransferase [Parahaliea aestuarii]|uniref:Methyltransferase domain-containing protein n=1 Tax=Parahaliea aestuarii TaxID=1852021 RepID=A0A5C8ZPB3_9GAMM|nr:class I SAM-dependent methyltransferase [Parahaliea aestuarii]TXS89439.1 methyltransferase domain-containing protein [Parahaliea aestuarii]
MTETDQLQRLLAAVDKPYALLDRAYLPLDQAQVKRTRCLQWIPLEAQRRGGKYAYAEWAHVVGIFQGLLHAHLPVAVDAPRVLDVGCGSGLMAIACEPFVAGGGHYTGLDVSGSQIEFCRNHYPRQGFEFVLHEAGNPFYSPERQAGPLPWAQADASVDMVTAVSVWTHFREQDARFYLSEVARVLRPGGRALITVFLLDDAYAARPDSAGSSRFHGTPTERWCFDQPEGESGGWFYPAWADVPEQAIGVTRAALDALLAESGLRQLAFYPGNWKERPGAFFQDVLVLEKHHD